MLQVNVSETCYFESLCANRWWENVCKCFHDGNKVNSSCLIILIITPKRRKVNPNITSLIIFNRRWCQDPYSTIFFNLYQKLNCVTRFTDWLVYDMHTIRAGIILGFECLSGIQISDKKYIKSIPWIYLKGKCLWCSHRLCKWNKDIGRCILFNTLIYLAIFK